jgi:hypothetical protein
MIATFHFIFLNSPIFFFIILRKKKIIYFLFFYLFICLIIYNVNKFLFLSIKCELFYHCFTHLISLDILLECANIFDLPNFFHNLIYPLLHLAKRLNSQLVCDYKRMKFRSAVVCPYLTISFQCVL